MTHDKIRSCWRSREGLLNMSQHPLAKSVTVDVYFSSICLGDGVRIVIGSGFRD